MQEQAVFTQKTEPVPPTGRFAPSPSGRLHLGNLACSLLAWLSAKSQGGRIVLRIEDLDAERCPRIYADLLEQDLDWLGLAWDEGGSTGGPNGPYYQSECAEIYTASYKKLEERGFEVTYLQPDALGRIALSDLQAALRRDTILVSIMMVNNESGAVMPIEKMAKLTHRLCPDAIFHTDAVQGFFKTPFRAASLGADLISVSGHKIHAAKGVGALYIRPGLSLPPLLYGGGQESKLRSGTEMLPLIAGFAAACESKLPTRQRDIAEQNRLKLLCRELLSRMDGVTLLGAQDAPHIVNLAVRGVRSQGLINALQDRDV